MNTLWSNWILRYPKLCLLVMFMLFLALGMGAKSLYFKADYKVFFTPDNPQRLVYEKMQAVYSKSTSVAIVVAPKSGDIYQPKTLQLITELTEKSWQTPYSFRVDSLSNFQHTKAEEDDLLVANLIYPETELTAQVIAQVRQVAQTEPLLNGKLVGERGTATLINIQTQLPDANKTKALAEITDYVDAMLEQYKVSHSDIDFHLTGIVPLNHSFASEAKSDFKTLFPLMYLAMVVMLIIFLRSILVTLSILLVIIFTIGSTLGIAGWLGFFISTPTANVPVIVMTLAVANSVHIISSILAMLRSGMEKREAILKGLKLNLSALLITSATTAVGFLILNFSPVPVLRDLGNLTAIGVGFALAFSVLVLPALLMLTPLKVKPRDDEKGLMMLLCAFVIKHYRRILPASVLSTLILGGFVFVNVVNDDVVSYFSKQTKFRQATDFMQQHISGMMSMDFSLNSKSNGGVSEPEFLQFVERYSQWLRQQPEVDHVASITDIYKRLNKNMHGDDQQYYRLPDNREEAAQYILLYEMSLPFGLDLNNQLNVSKSATRVVATLKNLGSQQLIGFEKRAYQWFDTEQKKHNSDYDFIVASPVLMFAHIGQANIESMVRNLPTALILISILLVIALRSLRLGAISLITNLAPVAVGFGLWGLFNGEINLGLSVVTGMCLGIIVDDTVHFLSKYQYARQSGKSAEEAIAYAFQFVGFALMTTTMVLVSGFSVLALSNFSMNADMGVLTTIILFVALILDLLLLPSVLLAFDRKSIYQQQ